MPGNQLESKDRICIVSAHYDSRGADIMDAESYTPGASDNASGTAAVIELARVLTDYEFDATIVFLVTASKEKGLLGANHFTEQARLQNRHIAGVLNNDRIGNNPSNKMKDTIRIFTRGVPGDDNLSQYQEMLIASGGENDTHSREVGRYMRQVEKHHLDDVSVDLIYRKDRLAEQGDTWHFLTIISLLYLLLSTKTFHIGMIGM